MQAALHGAAGDVEDLRDLGLAEVLVVPQHQHLAEALGQLREAEPEPAVTRELGRRHVVAPARARLLAERVERAPPRVEPAPTITAQVVGDLEQPGGEAPTAVEAIAGAGHADPALLEQVAGAVAGAPPQKGVERGPPAIDQGRERLCVTRLDRRHQVLVRAHGSRRYRTVLSCPASGVRVLRRIREIGSCDEERFGYNMRLRRAGRGGRLVAPQVLVVGGGLAGVSAAVGLREAGCGVQLLEREARVGGRAAGTTRDGFRLDDAPHLVSARDRRLLELIAAAGLAERFLPLRPVIVAHARGGRVEPAPPAGHRLEVARIGGVRLRQALRLHPLARLERRFAELLDPESPERAVRLDDRSTADFVRLYFGPSVLERWAEPMLGSDLLADAATASRVSFLIARQARGEAPLATLRAGPAELAEALVRPGIDRVGVAVRGLEPEPLALDTSDGVLRADAVVLAVPAEETLRLAAPALAPAECEALAAARSAPALVLHAALERSPTRKATRVRVPACEGSPLATVAIEPGGPGAPAPPGAALASLVARPAWSRAHLEADAGVIEKDLLAALERILPGASGAIRFCEIRRHVRGVPCFEVGRYRQLARLAALHAEGR